MWYHSVFNWRGPEPQVMTDRVNSLQTQPRCKDEQNMTDANPSDSGGRQDTCIDLEKKVEALTCELSEARERETATSEVLRVIASSPNDVQPVFNTIVTSAARLCKARYCWVFRFDGKLIHFAAEHGLSLEYIEAIRRTYPIPPGRASAAARAVLTGTVAEIPDVQADPDYAHGGDAKTMDFRSLLAVPLLKDGFAVGAIVIARTQTGRFPEPANVRRSSICWIRQ
jgi:hypothetical protein